MRAQQRALTAFAVLALVTTVGAQNPGPDWPQWRGPNRDGAVASFTAPKVWPEQLTQQWKVEVGLGYATPILIGPRLYMFSRQAENEVMSALDAASGKTIWQTGYPAPFTMQKAASRHGPGPKSTPVFSAGRLYAIGMTGVVTAFDATSGKQIWQKPGSSVVPMYTSHAFSPLVERGTVIFHVGGHDSGALTAYDLDTGDLRWEWKGDGPGYGSPVIAEFDGTRQVVTITQTKVVGVDAATGALLWERPFTSPSVNNAMTPLVYGRTVIVANNTVPTTALTVSRQGSQWVAETVWENAEIPMRMSNGVIVQDMLFSLSPRNMGEYFSADAKTGKALWTSEMRQAANAAIIRAGAVVFSLEDDGELVVFQGSPTSFEVLRRYKVADQETWTQPVISGNRIFVKDVSTLALWTLN
jgi:outer membrane protein assembly factor BamB